MPPITAAQISALQRNSSKIRNICILAHVDHGKTSLSDCLLAANGIISPKLAGRVRFLDSRPDEQLRGITMESSAISLLFRLARRPTPESEPVPEEFLINLIDSPGHIDFSSEVSTASRLCDGAIVLVDAVEGVCSQTVTVLRQAWIEHIKPILVINKIDRLITELQLTPEEAFDRMLKLVEQVNAVMGSFFAGERMEEDLRWREKLEERVAAAKASGATNASVAEDSSGVNTPAEAEFEEKDDEDIYFAPEKHNVIFSSAIDGWAFTIRQFAAIYEKKLGVKKELLEKVLWGKFYFDPKTKRVISEKHLKGRNLKPMFVQLVLNNIWAVYQCTVIEKDPERIEKIAKVLNVKVLPRDLKSKDPHSARSLMSSIFMQWIPLSTAVLVSVIEQLPPPPAAQAQRMPFIIETAPGANAISDVAKNALFECSTEPGAPVIAYVSKMISVPESELQKNQRVMLSAEEMRLKRMEIIRKMAAQANQDGADGVDDDLGTVTAALKTIGFSDNDMEPEKETEASDKETLIGFARLYSGTVKKGQELYVLGPKYNPAYPDQHIQKVTVQELYYMMGKDLEPLDEVPAGNVFGIGGLEGKLLKNGTLTTLPTGCLNLAGVVLGSAPIVRVALEPKNPSELGKMVEGLKLLEAADPCAEYVVQDNGEHVILTAGELHLERCLKDLRERFAKVEIQSSPPIVPFRETIVSVPDMPPSKDPNLPRGTVVAVTPSKEITVRLRVRPLPAAVTEFLVSNAASIKAIYAKKVAEEGAASEDDTTATLRQTEAERKILGIEEVKEMLRKAFSKVPAKEREVWQNVVERIVAFGPRRVGPNLLIDGTEDGALKKILSSSNEDADDDRAFTARDFEDKLAYAFQLATAAGPLCHEPVRGIACIIESFSLPTVAEKTFEVITSIHTSIRAGFLDWSPRLMLAMYSVDIQTSTEVLGRVHELISQRRGKTVSEEQEEGTPFWTIKALLPVVESFGFADEIRKRTSGAASPQLIFYGYEMYDEDPFWTPFTEEELEDLGDVADRENVAKRYMEKVRSRKGLAVKKRIVERAEKQKTLKR
ncbi:ribosome biogenesis protein [Ascodesmis nigricans]|uniref:Ribosome assembly protein 1 n=1 Tax=Ascodesmis nigricans TaxID=341454 RepID=A0A4S2N225_9PEZI|nr:ribosome biogenesis protein [Ascodesmis nigricans]